MDVLSDFCVYLESAVEELMRSDGLLPKTNPTDVHVHILPVGVSLRPLFVSSLVGPSLNTSEGPT